MSITEQEASEIRSEQKFLKDQISQVVGALQENTQRVGEMLVEMKERDVRDEYREKEFTELKEAVLKVDNKIDDFIEKKKPLLEWAERRKDVYDSIWNNATSTWGKIVGFAIIIGVAYVLGLDISKLVK